MSLPNVTTARKYSALTQAQAAFRSPTAQVATPRRSNLPALCSGSGVSSLPTVFESKNTIAISKVQASATAAAAQPDDRLTAREVVTELGKGAWKALKGIGTTFKAHPVICTAVAGGIAALLSAYPLLGAALLVFGVGSSAWEIGKGVVELRKGMRDHSKDEEDEGLEEVGEGLFGMAISAIGAIMAGPAAFGMGADTVTHAADAANAAGSFNPGMMFHAVDDLPGLFAAASRVQKPAAKPSPVPASS